MSEPLVIKFLREHSFNQLEEEHGVKAHPANRGPCNKWSLNYDQIKAKSGDQVAEECRGMVIALRDNQCLVVDDDNLWKDEVPGDPVVYAWPMRRFYNSGDTNAAELDWNTTRALEKLDGTMIVLYYDRSESKWCVATRSVPNADLQINSNGVVQADRTFTTLFKEGVQNTMSMSFDEWTAEMPTGYTYVFELTSPHNRVVVKYDETRVTWLAVRNTQMGHEYPVEEFRGILKEEYDVKMPPSPVEYPLSTLEGVLAYVNVQDPAQMEGIVLTDGKFNRVKVKNAKWVLSSKMHDAITTSKRSVLEAILTNKIDDVIPLLEGDLRTEVEALTYRVHRYLKKVDDNFKLWSTMAMGNRKEFAVLVMAGGDFKAPYFMLFEKKHQDAAECFKGLADSGRLSRDTLDFIISCVETNSY